MKKKRLVIFLAAALFLLAGCGQTEPAAPEGPKPAETVTEAPDKETLTEEPGAETVTEEPTAKTAEAQPAEQPFLVQVTDDDPSVAYVLVRVQNAMGLLPLPVEGEYTRTIRQTLEDGTELDRNDDATVYTLCATAFLLEGGYGFPKVEFQGIETTQSEALERYLQAHLDLPEGESDRITVVGARREGILGVLPTKTVVIGCLVFCVYLGFSGRKLKRYRDEYGNAP